ncbi:molybdopterin biosynthesis protein [Halocalculus aciditolerans]|uniref:Molybdopterin biosynthesis protein n=1 Tax=Halocalculus aciditolerans TaxID=1383812 RepID=A0A830F158_9EURY|nr:molybdopterin biosynthesis protein [Halocalculus aciditolerans]GGL51253.1 molybdopterin biosynthesis protein [Halocalculus aciditolerans]
MSDRREFRDLAAIDDARATVADLDLDPGTERVPLADARGRVLAERVDAGLDVPGFDRASMDGYAVRARDTVGATQSDPVTLDYAGAVHAGDEPTVAVDPGTCVEISTGAVLPDGADAVVMVERTSERDQAVEVRSAVAPGQHVMVAGADIAAGERALGPGTRLTPREIGLLAALGVDAVPVRKQPAVGIVSTGDELVPPGDPLDSARGEIYDVNSATIAAGVAEAGGRPKRYPHAGDDYDELETQLRRAAEECDLVLSSGSTSASAVDVVYRVIEDLGDLRLHGVAVKPGKPMLVGTLGDAAYVGLPGYPVSALTIFRTFVAPLIRDAAGLPEPRTAAVDATLHGEERSEEGRTRFLPVGLVETGEQTLAYGVDKGSGATTSLVDADGVVEIDADTAYLAAGEPVSVQLFSPDVRTPGLLAVGEDDPAFARALDSVSNPRYLSRGSRPGVRKLRDGLPDVAVAAGPTVVDGSIDVDVTDNAVGGSTDALELASWTREWGLLVPAGNPDGIHDLGDLTGDVRFVNRGTDAGLRASFDAALDDFAADRGTTRGDLTDAIDGYAFTVNAYESPARAVNDGKRDVGLGLRASADALGLDFLPLGDEAVRVLANPERTDKPGVNALGDALDAFDFDTLPGYDR